MTTIKVGKKDTMQIVRRVPFSFARAFFILHGCSIESKQLHTGSKDGSENFYRVGVGTGSQQAFTMRALGVVGREGQCPKGRG